MLFVFLLAAATAGAAEPPKIQTLIFTGRNNHDWRETTPYLRSLLTDTERFEVRVDEAPAGCTPATLAGFDLLVLHWVGPRWAPACEQTVAGFVRGGKGMVVVHGSSYPFGVMPILGDLRAGEREPPWPEFARMVGASWIPGPPRTGHGKRHTFQVRTVEAEHPILQGLPPSFPQNDELYHRMEMRPEARVLAVAFDASEMDGTGKDEPILWTVVYGGGRVFQTTLGHDVEAMSSAGFQATLRRGAEWAATGRVVSSPPPQRPLSLLVVTGGHDYDTSFYTLFQNTPDWRWDHRLHRASAEAFGRNLANHDVLVLYDMAQAITDEQKRNLTAYVERGGGLVVLHHALASFQSWPEYGKLIGGKYLLKPEGDTPGSGFQHDVWIDVKPADAADPVTRGIAPFRIYDEVYNKFRVAPESRPLLTTNHPNSDRTIAWVSPHPKARIVYIQLGHGQEAHHHPAFRRLVTQAIRWAAGRD